MNRIRQFLQLARVLVQPGAARAFVTWKPFSITAFRMLRALRRQGFAFGTILDGGANVGQFARAAAETFPEARIVAFEALPDVAAQCAHNLRDRPNVRVVRSALGSSGGTLTFHRNAYSPASSAREMHENHRRAFPEAQATETTEVPVATLDTLLVGAELARPVLLKLDLQGFEMEALRGAAGVLARTDYVLLEASLKPMYEGEALFDELYDFMRDAGFSFLRPLATLQDARGEIVQMDVLFARTPAT